MSQDNVEVLRRAIEAFPTDLDAWLDTMDPAIRWYPLEEGHSLVLGRAALRSRERWMETFAKESHRGELTELRGGEGENVFAAVYESGQGRASGIEIEGGVYIHYKVRNGKIVYCYEYESRDEALEAAGLSE